MISVLIPVYNYYIKPLVENLIDQFSGIECEWEILLSDDVSNDEFGTKNIDFINGINLSNVKLFQQKVNLGNAVNRNKLITYASYDWVLFLDADVFPVNKNFIFSYISKIKSTDKEIIAGNIIYDNNNPKSHLLRWKYGKRKEEINFEERKKNPLLHIRGANFAIKKELICEMNFPVLQEKYGFVDTRFFLQFNKNQVCIIENPVYHLGIEENSVFVNKTKQAISNALFLMKTNNELAMKITLVSSYKKIKIYRRLLAKIYLKFNPFFEKKLNSKNPSILIFQIYKLLYMSYLDVFKNA